ncbi:MAG: hydrogenase nickel incorporation protein HypB [Betaproteobacteria bacterium]|nr:hydrogenase nickel incorporation protein HypB [Betaproteobacteria bacterium]
MCTTCGCGQGETRIDGVAEEHEHTHVHADGTVHTHRHSHGHDHEHAHQHDNEHANEHAGAYRPVVAPGHLHYGHGPAHAHAAGMSQTRMVQIEQDILAKNDAYASANRQRFAARGIHALNLVSSPGSGKTTLLVKTIAMLQGRLPLAVIEGDQQTSQDAERIRATGVPAVQINTGKGCHLDARMVGQALEQLDPPQNSLLMIENVGNLVCPAAFDLGEACKVVILSVTEGEDKPLKYPDMFRAARLMLLNKCDLLPYLSFNVTQAIDYAKRINPDLAVIQTSATSGAGMDEWVAWIETAAAETRRRACAE